MMEINSNFIKNISNSDTIYHYTKASTAIDFILHNENLRFQQARKSNDPIESRKAERRTVSYITGIEKSRSKKQFDDENQLHAFINNLEEEFHQICFCQNRIEEDLLSEGFISNFYGHEESFGFTKLRMWDQYADRFSGVCIAFSKEKIISKNSGKFDLLEGDVQYLTFQELLIKKPGDIQADHLANCGVEQYQKQLEESVKESFFYKHLDYSGETEYRIGTFFHKEKCSIDNIRGEIFFDRSMMLDIAGCIKAIFVSSFANERQKDDLLDYANKFNIGLIEMDWQYNSFKARDYRKWKHFFNELK